MVSATLSAHPDDGTRWVPVSRRPAMPRTPLRLLILIATTALGALVLAVPAQAAPFCGITWGSQPKAAAGQGGSVIDDVRAGRHACFDRLVVDLGGAGGVAGYTVRYVPRVTEDGSGHVVPLRGGAALEIVVRSVPYDDSGAPTYTPASRTEIVNVSGYRTFRQVAWAGAFEGQTTLGVGTRARLPFRVFTLPGGSGGHPRVVIDVAHRW